MERSICLHLFLWHAHWSVCSQLLSRWTTSNKAQSPLIFLLKHTVNHVIEPYLTLINTLDRAGTWMSNWKQTKSLSWPLPWLSWHLEKTLSGELIGYKWQMTGKRRGGVNFELVLLLAVNRLSHQWMDNLDGLDQLFMDMCVWNG